MVRDAGLAVAAGVAWVLATSCLLFFAVPVLALLVRQPPGSVLEALTRPQVTDALRLSVATTATATLLAVLTGLPAAYILARRLLPWSDLIGTVVTLPTVLPPVVAGVALLVAFGRRGLLGQYLLLAGVTIPFTPAAVVLAQLL